jgi:hypothetical protein
MLLELGLGLLSLLGGKTSKTNNSDPISKPDKGRMLELALGDGGITSTNVNSANASSGKAASDSGLSASGSLSQSGNSSIASIGRFNASGS